MFKTYDLFDHRNINDLVPEIVYYYLFQGLSLTAIEVKLFKTEDYHGWLSKTFLNYYGIDTEKENKGIYADTRTDSLLDLKQTIVENLAIPDLFRRGLFSYLKIIKRT